MYHVRYIIIAVLAAVSLTGSAQQFVVIKTHEGQEVIPAGDIERITLEQDASFHARLLPQLVILAETNIFSVNLVDCVKNSVRQTRSWHLQTSIIRICQNRKESSCFIQRQHGP